MARPFRRRREQPRTRGQTLVEFALVLPIFLLILFALIDVGRWVYAQNSLNEATREAARGVTVTSRPSDCASGDARDLCAQKIVQNRVFAVGGPVTVTTTCYRWAAGVRTAVTMSTCTVGDYVQVVAEVRPWQVLTPLLSSFLTTHIDGSAQSQVKS